MEAHPEQPRPDTSPAWRGQHSLACVPTPCASPALEGRRITCANAKQTRSALSTRVLSESADRALRPSVANSRASGYTVVESLRERLGRETGAPEPERRLRARAQTSATDALSLPAGRTGGRLGFSTSPWRAVVRALNGAQGACCSAGASSYTTPQGPTRMSSGRPAPCAPRRSLARRPRRQMPCRGAERLAQDRRAAGVRAKPVHG